MERGYLYLLIGALLKASTLLPFNMNVIPFFSLEFFGYLLIIMGIRYMRTSEKELKNSYYFTIATLMIRFILPLVRTTNFNFFSILTVLNIFFSVGIFFWIFKAEYMWSPHTTKRMDLLIYSIVSLIYLVIYGIFIFPMISFRILSQNAISYSFEVLRFINILYYGVLIYILVKLYLEARKNTPGFDRWG